MATGITPIQNDTDNPRMYNLKGQIVDTNYKGIVIINGEKFIRK